MGDAACHAPVGLVTFLTYIVSFVLHPAVATRCHVVGARRRCVQGALSAWMPTGRGDGPEQERGS
ncbi:MAG: hypothetical protein JWM90_949, partial [Thermoleophilia bacterium]|nr:hypothetical protein [Thermoleophilia bacterium]